MRSVSLVGVDGTSVDLMSRPYELAVNPSLWGVPPVATFTTPTLTGERFQSSRFQPRMLGVPVWIQGDTSFELDASLASLARLTHSQVGPCRIVVDRGDGTAREIVARYSSGLDAVTIRDRERARAYAPLVFTAHEPYWQALEEIEYDILASEYIGGGEPTPFASDIPFASAIPFNGFNESGVQRFSIDLAGDVEAHPRWTIVGPASDIQATNITTGQTWSYTPALGVDRELILDAGSASVTLDEVNVFSSLSDESELWSLVPGRNHIQLRVQNWDAGSSSKLLLSWRERYLTC